MKPKQTRRAESVLKGFCFDIGENKIENKSKATEICRMRCLLSQMFTLDSKHTPSRHKIRAQEEQETFVVVNRRQFGANYIPVI